MNRRARRNAQLRRRWKEGFFVRNHPQPEMRFSKHNTSGHFILGMLRNVTLQKAPTLGRQAKGKRIEVNSSYRPLLYLCSLRKQRRRHHPAIRQHRSSHTGLTLFGTCMCDTLRRAPIKIPEKYVRNDVFVQFISALIWFLEKEWHDVTIAACHKWSHGASMRARAPPAPR